jgi:hypothetical protein
VITIANWELYQDAEENLNSNLNNKRTTDEQQMNTNKNTNTKYIDTDKEDISKPDKEDKHKYGEYGWIRLTDIQYQRLLNELGQAELERCIKLIDESAQGTGNKNKWKDWNLTIRRCSREKWGVKSYGSPTAPKSKPIYQSQQTQQTPEQARKEFERMKKHLDELRKDDDA